MIFFNEVIYNERIKRCLSIHEASKKIGIPSILLKKYENGNYKPTKKYLKKICIYYDIPLDYFKQESFIYSKDIYQDDANEKNKIFIRKLFCLSMIAILALLLGVVILFYNISPNNIRNYYSNDFNILMDEFFKSSIVDNDDSIDYDPDIFYDSNLIDDGSDDSIDDSNETPWNDILDIIMIFLGDSNYTDSKRYLLYEFPDYIVRITTNNDRNRLGFLTFTYVKKTDTESYQIVIENNAQLPFATIIITNLFDLSTIASFDYIYKTKQFDGDYDDNTISILNESLQAINQIINDNFIENYTALNAITDFKLGFTNFAIWYFIFYISLLLIPLLILLLIYILIKDIIYDNIKFRSSNLNISEEGALLPTKYKFYPIFNERLLRLIGLLILFLASFSIFISFLYTRGGIISHIKSVPRLASLFKKGLNLSIVLLFFVKIDISLKKKDLPSSTVLFLILGLYYFYCSFFSFYHFHFLEIEPLLMFIEKYLPGNIFFGISSYFLITLFLFTTPKKFENKKKLTILWRSLVVIPILYLIFSNFILPFLNVPFRYYFLFYPKSLITSLFTIFYLISIYIYNKYIIKKYKKNALIFMNSKIYYMKKNLIASIIILILSLADLILKYKLDINQFSFGTFYYMVLIIPIILFYQPRLEQRNRFEDILYAVLYLICFASSYIGFAIYFFEIYSIFIPELVTIYIWFVHR